MSAFYLSVALGLLGLLLRPLGLWSAPPKGVWLSLGVGRGGSTVDLGSPAWPGSPWAVLGPRGSEAGMCGRWAEPGPHRTLTDTGQVSLGI